MKMPSPKRYIPMGGVPVDTHVLHRTCVQYRSEATEAQNQSGELKACGKGEGTMGELIAAPIGVAQAEGPSPEIKNLVIASCCQNPSLSLYRCYGTMAPEEAPGSRAAVSPEQAPRSNPIATLERITCWADATDEDEQIPGPVAQSRRVRRKPRIYTRQLLLSLRRLEHPASPRLRARRLEELPPSMGVSRRQRPPDGPAGRGGKKLPVHVFDPIVAAATCEVVLSWLTSTEGAAADDSLRPKRPLVSLEPADPDPRLSSALPEVGQKVSGGLEAKTPSRPLRPNAAEFRPARKAPLPQVEEESGQEEEEEEEDELDLAKDEEPPRRRFAAPICCGILVALLATLLGSSIHVGQPKAQPAARPPTSFFQTAKLTISEN
ncbi:unnamed protein product [Symbiodinium sp. KB8]|nr:unnamed protein product [Symbiodinium sp. KB8]